MKPHYNILIATPGNKMESEYVNCLVDTISYLHSNNISYKFINQYSSQVDAARESTIMNSRYLGAFNKSPLHGEATYDKIIWIDSDMGWTIEDFMKMYNSDKDIISGLYFSDHMVPMFTKESIDSMNLLNTHKDIFEIDYSGFGFICMKEGVFENIPRPWFGTEFQKIKNDDGIEEIYIPWGEDYSWCVKAKKQGYKIYLDPTVKLSHYKKIRVGIK